MNFSVYVNKKTGQKISKLAKSLKRSKNSIITEALNEWLERHTKANWPKNFFDFEPFEDFPDKEELRKGLIDKTS